MAAAARAPGCPAAVKTAAPERCTAGSSGAAGSSEEEGKEEKVLIDDKKRIKRLRLYD